MKRKYYKESFIALAVVLFFDFLRLFYVINTGINNIFDFMWTILLLIIVFFTYLSKEDKGHIHLLNIILGFVPLLFVVLISIQIGSTGQIFEFNYFFILFECVLITGINILYLYEIIKNNKENSIED